MFSSMVQTMERGYQAWSRRCGNIDADKPPIWGE
jgi:hypothetical protein